MGCHDKKHRKTHMILPIFSLLLAAVSVHGEWGALYSSANCANGTAVNVIGTPRQGPISASSGTCRKSNSTNQALMSSPEPLLEAQVGELALGLFGSQRIALLKSYNASGCPASALRTVQILALEKCFFSNGAGFMVRENGTASLITSMYGSATCAGASNRSSTTPLVSECTRVEGNWVMTFVGDASSVNTKPNGPPPPPASSSTSSPGTNSTTPGTSGNGTNVVASSSLSLTSSAAVLVLSLLLTL